MKLHKFVALFSVLAVLLCAAAQGFEDENAARCFPVPCMPKGFDKIEHIIVIYQENWSFDGLYGHFPNPNVEGTKAVEQIGIGGLPLVLREPLGQENEETGERAPFPKIADLKETAAPYDLAKYVGPNGFTGDLIHNFYTEQAQINKGAMNKFYALSDSGGLVMSYYDASNLPEGKLAQEFTLCDHFFHAGFGGSFLNHQLFIAARPPEFRDAKNNPAEAKKLRWDEGDEEALNTVSRRVNFGEPKVTKDGYAVNTLYSVFKPFARTKPDVSHLLPPQMHATIGDRLNERGVSWAWYAGGYDDAMAGHHDKDYQFHHQPFVYFANFGDGTENKCKHLLDEKLIYRHICEGKLPRVSFVKFLGENNEHPEYANLEKGQAHTAQLVEKIRCSKYWKKCAIVIAYDENGGRWDHVAPPNLGDRFGPGSRVPCIVISPYAKRGFIDKTPYTTCSILKFIESRFKLRPLTFRDANANNFENAFCF